ncbi:4Fe-4S dicluster domain-containing protein [Roseicella frigidaeris]|uniref:4Fe-4S ferredoxin n=1 Tax=Roseicella frigidaeris TaxID=2230885 RepID=A0A327MD89_9PROT|nr:4Fe-4S dicluster domain-containing protein [Roseicella frigidaeris]RAI60023.1 4Fe-4S ferredoxin [Roseicella frigidaeris]
MTSSPQLDRRRLLLGRSAAADAPLVAGIAADCLAFRGIACMSCRDACATGAIRFSLARGGAVPRIEREACNGCADCVPVCPVAAIALAPLRAGETPDA